MGDWSELRPYPHVLGHLGGEKGACARVEVGRPAGLQRWRRSCRGEFSLRCAARMAHDAAAYGPGCPAGPIAPRPQHPPLAGQKIKAAQNRFRGDGQPTAAYSPERKRLRVRARSLAETQGRRCSACENGPQLWANAARNARLRTGAVRTRPRWDPTAERAGMAQGQRARPLILNRAVSINIFYI